MYMGAVTKKVDRHSTTLLFGSALMLVLTTQSEETLTDKCCRMRSLLKFNVNIDYNLTIINGIVMYCLTNVIYMGYVEVCM